MGSAIDSFAGSRNVTTSSGGGGSNIDNFVSAEANKNWSPPKKTTTKTATVTQPKKSTSLLSKVKSGVKDFANAAVTGERVFATGIARDLPGGTADLDAQRKQAEQASKDAKFVSNQVKAGKISKAQAAKILKTNAQSAGQASKDTKETIKAMPTKKDIALGAASTGADIITAGTFSKGKAGLTGAKELKPLVEFTPKAATGAKTALQATKTAAKKTAAANVALESAGNAVAGGLNAAAGGGSTQDMIKNAAAGAVLPPALHTAGTVTTKAANSILDKIRAPKELVQKVKQQTLLDAATKKEAAAATEKTAKIDQKIELIKAKEADGKFTNVDKVKVKQLEEEKAALQPKPITSSEPTQSTLPPAESKSAVPVQTETPVVPAKSSLSESLPNNKPVAEVKPSTTAEPTPTRMLKPSETAHMPEVGGYTHSKHLAQDYADMLRGQEQSARGGQKISDGQGGYTRTSEHSKFYRDFYKENKKAPTKADYLEQAKKELENNKDGIGAGDDYKKLLEREGKPVPRVQVETTVKDVPQGTSKVAKRIAEKLKQEYGDLASYDKITIEDQAKKAEALMSDKAKLDKVISGEAPLPDGLRATSVITAVTHDPKLAKDADLMRKLAASPLASESSYSAQELRLARENARYNPITAIKNVMDARAKTFEERSGKTVAKATAQEVAKINTTTPKIPKETFASFVESLKC